jgi:replicative DNA helicase
MIPATNKHTELTNELINTLSTWQKTPLTTGIFEYDRNHALGIDDFVMLGGATGQGKSYVALYIACSIAKSGKKVIYYNNEVAEHTMWRRVQELGFSAIDFGELENGRNRLIIICVGSITLDTLLSDVARLGVYDDISAIFLDMISMMFDAYPLDKNQFEMQKNLLTHLSTLPTKINAMIFATSQLTKDNTRISRRPNKDDFEGVKQITTKPTKVIALYRHYKTDYVKSFTGENEQEDLILKNMSELINIKDRDRDTCMPHGITLIKYVKDKGFKAPEYWERQAYIGIISPKGNKK